MNHFFLSSLPDNITHHAIGGRSKGPDKYTKESENIAHGVRYSETCLTMMLNKQIKKEPANDADGVLKNQRARKFKNSCCILLIKFEIAEQRVPSTDTFGSDHNKNHEHAGKF